MKKRCGRCVLALALSAVLTVLFAPPAAVAANGATVGVSITTQDELDKAVREHGDDVNFTIDMCYSGNNPISLQGEIKGTLILSRSFGTGSFYTMRNSVGILRLNSGKFDNNGGSITTANVNGGELENRMNGTITTVNLNDGTLANSNGGTIATANVSGGGFYNNAVITTANVNGGTLENRNNGAIITTVNVNGGELTNRFSCTIHSLTFLSGKVDNDGTIKKAVIAHGLAITGTGTVENLTVLPAPPSPVIPDTPAPAAPTRKSGRGSKPSAPETVPLLDGGGAVYSGSGTLSFRFDAPPPSLEDVYVSGTRLEQGRDYTVTRGSTVITLTERFLARLTPGRFFLAVTFDGVSGGAAFHVDDASAAEKEPTRLENGSKPNPGTGAMPGRNSRA